MSCFLGIFQGCIAVYLSRFKKSSCLCKNFLQASLPKISLVQRTVLRQRSAGKFPYEPAFLVLPAFCCFSAATCSSYHKHSALSTTFFEFFNLFFNSFQNSLALIIISALALYQMLSHSSIPFLKFFGFVFKPLCSLRQTYVYLQICRSTSSLSQATLIVYQSFRCLSTSFFTFLNFLSLRIYNLCLCEPLRVSACL